MRARAALAALCVALPRWALGSNFVGSLHSNFVVNLDFEKKIVAASPGGADASGARGESSDLDDDTKVLSFAGGKQKFRCRVPSSKRRPEKKPLDEAKLRAHFRSAKVAPLKGRCWTQPQDYWTYDLCFGRRVVQYRADSEMRLSLGEHDPELDALLPGGAAVEHFTGGTGNRSTEVHYTCGSYGEQALSIAEPGPLRYAINFSSPAFCSWREKDGAETRDDAGRVMKASALLEDLRGSCLNLTQGWWTYEYCFPSSMRQFHANGKQRDPDYSLGQLGTGAALDVDGVEMDIARMSPGVNTRERRATPSGTRVLKQRLGAGTVCDETRRPRASTMMFQCPSDWQSKPETRIVSINEAALCEYEILVHTPLLCGHHRLIPVPRAGKEVIQCDAEPEEEE